MSIGLILDCDTGTDDAIAIMLAALDHRLRLVAVTSVNGNVPVDVVAENSLRVLEWVGVTDVPVYVGASHAIDRPDFPVSRKDLKGFEMHGTYLDLPPAVGRVQGISAVEYLRAEAHRLLSAGEKITLVATGPLTNIAEAVRTMPEFPRAIDRLIVMGGGHAVSNVTASAEFNFWADPESAKDVLNAGFTDVTVVPLDATHRALISRADCDAFRALGTKAGAAAAQIIEQRIAGHDDSQPMQQSGTAPVHDAVCIALLIDPSVVTTIRANIDVETTGTITIGRSVIDLHRRSGVAPNAAVAMDANPSRFVELLTDAFATPAIAEAGQSR